MKIVRWFFLYISNLIVELYEWEMALKLNFLHRRAISVQLRGRLSKCVNILQVALKLIYKL